MFWSKIGSGFGQPGDTPVPRIPRSTTPPETIPILFYLYSCLVVYAATLLAIGLVQDICLTMKSLVKVRVSLAYCIPTVQSTFSISILVAPSSSVGLNSWYQYRLAGTFPDSCGVRYLVPAFLRKTSEFNFGATTNQSLPSFTQATQIPSHHGPS